MSGVYVTVVENECYNVIVELEGKLWSAVESGNFDDLQRLFRETSVVPNYRQLYVSYHRGLSVSHWVR